MKTLLSGVIIMDTAMDELNRKVQDATDKFLDRRALIFIEEAIANYSARHGVKKTRQYLTYMLDYLHEFEREEDQNV